MHPCRLPLLCRSRLLRQTGFTLIEMLVTVVLVAILASIAYPAYTNYVIRGQLQDAFTNLADYRIKLEQYYQDNKSYSTGTTCGQGNAWASFPITTKYFTLTCSVTSSKQGYTLTATGTSGKLTAYTYTIDDTGAKKTTAYPGHSGAINNCWAIKSASDCY